MSLVNPTPQKEIFGPAMKKKMSFESKKSIFLRARNRHEGEKWVLTGKRIFSSTSEPEKNNVLGLIFKTPPSLNLAHFGPV